MASVQYTSGFGLCGGSARTRCQFWKLTSQMLGLSVVCETLCRISRLCLGATVYKEGQLCWSSRYCLHMDIWTQFTVALPTVAEAKASHQKAQTRYTVSWKFRGTSQAQKPTCPLFEVTSTGATLSFRRIPYSSLLYPPESRPWIKVRVSAIFVALFFFLLFHFKSNQL